MTNTNDELEAAILQQQQATKRVEELKKLSRDKDLELVKTLCKRHGFTATQLRGCLVTRGKGGNEEAAKKPRKAKDKKEN
jgi:hypothetical protein